MVVDVVVVEVVAILNFGLVFSAAETAWANKIPKIQKSDLVIGTIKKIIDLKISSVDRCHDFPLLRD